MEGSTPMDILQPPLEQQASPAPWRLARQRIDVRSLVKRIHSERPFADADEIVAVLADWGIQTSGIWVAHWLSTLTTSTGAHSNVQTMSREKPQPSGNESNRHSRVMKPSTRRQPVLNRTDIATTALNRFFVLTYYSLARYLEGASPWVRDTALGELVKQIADEHEDFAVRAARLIVERRANLDLGRYPTQFTSFNYLALEYLAGPLVDHVGSMIAEMETCLNGLRHDHEAASLVSGAIESQRARLIALKTALAQPESFQPVLGTVAATKESTLHEPATLSPAAAAGAREGAIAPHVAA
jgi:hypothetical protein